MPLRPDQLIMLSRQLGQALSEVAPVSSRYIKQLMGTLQERPDIAENIRAALSKIRGIPSTVKPTVSQADIMQEAATGASPKEAITRVAEMLKALRPTAKTPAVAVAGRVSPAAADPGGTLLRSPRIQETAQSLFRAAEPGFARRKVDPKALGRLDPRDSLILERIKQALSDNPDVPTKTIISQTAKELGIRPDSLSRKFRAIQKQLGVTPSDIKAPRRTTKEIQEALALEASDIKPALSGELRHIWRAPEGAAPFERGVQSVPTFERGRGGRTLEELVRAYDRLVSEPVITSPSITKDLPDIATRIFRRQPAPSRPLTQVAETYAPEISRPAYEPSKGFLERIRLEELQERARIAERLREFGL
jgi:hypothetical protein